MTDRKPEKTFRHGNVSVSIWKNEGKHGPYYLTTFQRSYKREGETDYSYAQTFGLFDLWNVVRCAADASTYINKTESSAQRESS